LDARRDAVREIEVKRLRAWWRGGGVLALTVGLYALWFVGWALLFASVELRRRWRRLIFATWGRLVCRVLAVRVSVTGVAPERGAFLVANHLSYLDIPVLASQMSTVFVSKAEVAGWPVIGAGARAMGTIFLVRERKRDLPHVNRQIEEALANGDGVVVFPEGTSTRGAEILPFRPSLLAPAAETGAAVRSAILRYETAAGDPPASTAVCWWGDMEFTPHVAELLRLERIEAQITFLPDAVADPDRKELAEKLWGAVKSRFRPVP